MINQIQVTFSNRIEELYHQFKDAIFHKNAPPFARRLVIVSNPALKSWLMLQLAKDPQIGIGAGLEISYLDQTIQKLNPSEKRVPDQTELTLAIEWEIKQIISANPSPEWNPLLKYLQHKPGSPFSMKSEKRLILLADQLASLFLDYGKYGSGAIAEWEKQGGTSWQKILWNQIFSKGSYSYLYRELKKPFHLQQTGPLSVHLFSISFLPKLYLNFFTDLAKEIPTFHYLLSPCQLFWSDLRSSKEIKRLKIRLHKIATPLQKEELDNYLSNANSLLANLGKVGRKMAEEIEGWELPAHERYTLPEALLQNENYRDLISPEIKIEPSLQKLTLLQAIQGDLVLLRNPEEGEKISFEHYDKTIQFHGHFNRLREIESLHNILLNLIDLSSDATEPIAPEDIVVMAPDIAGYEPFIKMVFSGSGKSLAGKILDRHLTTQGQLVQGFLHLLSLPFGRWGNNDLLQLFNYKSFQNKQGLSEEDLNILKKWIEDTGINWGQSPGHRNEILQREHCNQGMDQSSSAGTWEFGMDQLLAGLVFDPAFNKSSAFPYDEIEFSQSDLLGKILSLIDSLYKDLAPLADGSKFKLPKWAEILQNLFEKYFEPVEEDADDGRSIICQINEFCSISAQLKEASFSFLSLRKPLNDKLGTKASQLQDAFLSAVKFCSILPMRTIPAKVVAWIGMEEGAFPRREKKLSLNMLKDNPLADYNPTQTDYDRYLFLEGLLSARQYFIMSYLNQSQEDSREQAPSLLLAELMNYMDSAYVIEGGLPSLKCSFNHFYMPFDRHYFSPESLWPSYSESHYKMAKAFYQIEKKPRFHLIPHFIPPEENLQEDKIRISLDQLISFAKNPLKSYFNQKLGIYLEYSEKRESSLDEKFQFTPLDKHRIKLEALTKPLNKLFEEYEKKGGGPIGFFKDLAQKNISEEIEALKQSLGIPCKNLFEIHFSESYTIPCRSEKGDWLLPPLHLRYEQKNIKITGRFEHVSDSGLILNLNTTKEDMVKALPQALIFQALIQAYTLPVEKNYHFSKSGKIKKALVEDPLHWLERFLEYYFLAVQNPSPLIPEWISAILFSHGEERIKKIEESINHSFKKNYNEYAKWILKGGNFPYLETAIQEWKEIGDRLYLPLFSEWGG